MTRALLAILATRPLAVAVGLWLLQGILAYDLPLVADEAYYQDWAERPDLGYFDHPPGIAWWIALGGGHPRLLGILLLPLGLAALADAGRRWGIARWRWLPALWLATPLGFSAGLLATPDIPLLFFYCGVLWALSARRIVLAGAFFGLCLLAKSTAWVAAPGLLLVALAQSSGNRRAVLGAITVALMIWSPNVWWSLQNDGLPWTFQMSRGWTGFHLHELLGGQLLVLGPILMVLIASCWWRAPRTDPLRLLSLPILGVYLLASLGTRVEANWPALAYPAAALLVLKRADVKQLRLGIVTSGTLTLAAAVALPLLTRFTPVDLGPPRDPQRLAACYAAAADGLPIVAARYQERALLGPSAGYLRAMGHRASQYDRWAQPPLPPHFLYLAGERALGSRCAHPGDAFRACGRVVTLCHGKLADSPGGG